jgi:hypothetical protein
MNQKINFCEEIDIHAMQFSTPFKINFNIESISEISSRPISLKIAFLKADNYPPIYYQLRRVA